MNNNNWYSVPHIKRGTGCPTTYLFDRPFSNLKFMLDEMTWRNVSIFSIFCINQYPKLFFQFFMSCYFFLSLMNFKHKYHICDECYDIKNLAITPLLLIVIEKLIKIQLVNSKTTEIMMRNSSTEHERNSNCFLQLNNSSMLFGRFLCVIWKCAILWLVVYVVWVLH